MEIEPLAAWRLHYHSPSTIHLPPSLTPILFLGMIRVEIERGG
jgi:hypothetical protein